MGLFKRSSDDSDQYRNSDGEFVGEKGSGSSKLCAHPDKARMGTKWVGKKFCVHWKCTNPECGAEFDEPIP